MVPVRILDVAAEEVARAAEHIEIERPGHGAPFLDAYADQLDLIATFPSLGAPVLDAPEGHTLRAFLIPRFGYRIESSPASTVTKCESWRSATPLASRTIGANV